MIGETISYYPTLEKLGDGGMCAGYKAFDAIQNRALLSPVGLNPELPIDLKHDINKTASSI